MTLRRSVRRYWPVAVAGVVLAAVIVVFGRGDGGAGSPSDSRGSGSNIDEEQLTRDGPTTPQRAALLGEEEVDFGPDCDPETGRIRLPSVYAPQCVVPFEGNNGGATSSGVTGEEILLVRYQAAGAENSVAAATIGAGGESLYTDSDAETVQRYVDVYQKVFETYGRQVRVVTYVGTGSDSDADAARADARAIADMKPFAVIDGPLQQSTAFATELAARGVLCLGFCPVTVPEDVLRANAPYIWPGGPTANQTATLAAELIGNLAGPGKAELAGDPDMQDRERKYALVHYNNPDGDHTVVFETMRDQLARQGVELTTDVEFQLDFVRQQETARTIVARLQEAEITTVIFYGDFITPMTLTKEATAQDYHPEWILGPSLLADTARFARTFDQEQWVNGFGIGISPARGSDNARRIYEWAYGAAPPSPNFGRLELGLQMLFVGIHLAGPTLTPESFRDGLFRYVPSGGGPYPLVSRGSDGTWEGVDYGGFDDAGVIWWDADATGPDETGGENGTGLYRHALEGRRYAPGEFPETAEEAGLFDEASSVTHNDELPTSNPAPLYPPPTGD